MIKLAHPWFLILIIMIIPIFFLGNRSGGRFKFSSLDTLKQLNISTIFNPRQILVLLRIITLIFFVIALSRPQSGKKFTKVTSEGIDIMLLLDTSGSMQAMDFKLKDKRVNRLEIVKEVVKEFVHKRAGDRLGIIVFGDDAYTQCPLTLDHGIVLEFLKKLEIGMAGRSTAIGSAIGVGVKRMKELKAKTKIMILLTDGKNTSGSISPDKAAELANTFDIKIYTVGAGTKGEAPFLVDHPLFGKRYVYQPVEFDEESLKNIAETTNAKYFAANNTKELLNIYEEIDKLEKTKIEAKEYTEYHELFHFFLIIGIFTLLIEIVLGQTILRKIP